MCRRSKTPGIALLAAGIGVLLAGLIGSGFWQLLLGIGLVAAGLLIGFSR